MSASPRCLLLHDAIPPGAKPDETDVLEQAQSVGRSLRRLGFSTSRAEVGLDLASFAARMRRSPPDLVFNLVESLEGKGRFIAVVPALLETLGIPYTGNPADALFLTSNKLLSKRAMAAAGVPVPACATLRGPAPTWRGPSIVKSLWEHASIGLDEDSVLDTADHARLRRKMRERSAAVGGEFFAEQYVEGREFNLTVIGTARGPRVLPPAEITFDGYGAGKRRVVGYRAKWHEDSFEYKATDRRFAFPPRDRLLLAELREVAARCWRLFGLRGYARVDFRVDRRGRPWVLEVNANPCINEYSGFTAACARGGIDYDRMVSLIVDDTLREAR